MNQLLEKLKCMDCDIDGAMSRFLDNEEFYVRCLKKMLLDPSFALLGEALRDGDVDKAFHHAHTLKGVVANMGLTPLYDLIVRIVEPLRAGHMEDGLLDAYQRVLAQRDSYQKLLETMGLS